MKTDYSNKRRRIVIDVGANVFLPQSFKITVPNFTVGDNTRINGPITVRGEEDCRVGKYCAFGYNITIITSNHEVSRANLQLNMQRYYGFKSLEVSKGPVNIGNNVWIGDSVTILSGVNIGDGCIIGAGAVVDKNVPPCSIAVGVPACVARQRFKEGVIDEFLKVAWWDWPEEKIAKNKRFFEADLASHKGRLKELISE